MNVASWRLRITMHTSEAFGEVHDISVRVFLGLGARASVLLYVLLL